jgi:hypothetical protein
MPILKPASKPYPSNMGMQKRKAVIRPVKMPEFNPHAEGSADHLLCKNQVAAKAINIGRIILVVINSK